MKRIVLIAAALAAAALAAPGTASAYHGSLSCYGWAAHDAAHPGAPESYIPGHWRCEGYGGDYVLVAGRGYSGQIHRTLLHGFHIWDGTYVVVEGHAHPYGLRLVSKEALPSYTDKVTRVGGDH